MVSDRITANGTRAPAAVEDPALADVAAPVAPPANAADRAAAGSRWGVHGPRPLGVLAMVAFIDAADRGVLPGVLSRVQEDLQFSDTQAGLLGTAFVVTGFLVVLPAGYLADRYRRTRIIAVVLASWGVVSALNSLVRNYWQFLAVRASLGVGETIDNPASQSLIADFYPPAARGRAYAVQRLAPVIGTALGTGLGGLVGSLLGWRWAFVIIGVPGSLLAVAVWRLHEPPRGGADGAGNLDLGHVNEPAPPAPRHTGLGALWRDVREVASSRLLRSLVAGSAIALGALVGVGFWLPSFYERHYGLGSGAASGLTGGLVLVGAFAGTYGGGFVTDRLRPRIAGAPMLVGGVAQLAGGVLAAVAFLPVPLGVHVPLQLLAVALIAAGLPAFTVMIAEAVPSSVRGTAFSLNSFVGSCAGAASPFVLGVVADRFPIVVDGETKGSLASAFLAVMPLVCVGAIVVLRGRRHATHHAHVEARTTSPSVPR